MTTNKNVMGWNKISDYIWTPSFASILKPKIAERETCSWSQISTHKKLNFKDKHKIIKVKTNLERVNHWYSGFKVADCFEAFDMKYMGFPLILYSDVAFKQLTFQ